MKRDRKGFADGEAGRHSGSSWDLVGEEKEAEGNRQERNEDMWWRRKSK